MLVTSTLDTRHMPLPLPAVNTKLHYRHKCGLQIKEFVNSDWSNHPPPLSSPPPPIGDCHYPCYLSALTLLILELRKNDKAIMCVRNEGKLAGWEI